MGPLADMTSVLKEETPDTHTHKERPPNEDQQEGAHLSARQGEK